MNNYLVKNHSTKDCVIVEGDRLGIDGSIFVYKNNTIVAVFPNTCSIHVLKDYIPPTKEEETTKKQYYEKYTEKSLFYDLRNFIKSFRKWSINYRKH